MFVFSGLVIKFATVKILLGHDYLNSHLNSSLLKVYCFLNISTFVARFRLGY
uniref:Uncharacterized protein n=1 Tax=Arundo donax TaxID=35708 RepID=A0A0A9B0Q7_ARUDO